MANFNHPPMPLDNPYTFVNPFQVSINFSLKNLIRSRGDQEETTIDDIPLPPQRYMTHVATFVPPRSSREPSASYYSLSPSSNQSRSPPASSNRNTFGIEAVSRKEPRMLSPKPRVSKSSILPPRSGGEALPDNSAIRHSQLHQAASVRSTTSGSDRSHRRHLSTTKGRSSRETGIILDHQHSLSRTSGNAISFYKPPTRSSEVALPSSSPYLPTFLPPSIPEPTHAIKHEYPIPSASQSPLPSPHYSPNLPTYICAFLLDTLPRQVYLNLMLRLPHLYFTHVIRIFEDAEMSMPEIKKMALEANNYLKDPTISNALHLDSEFDSPRYDNLAKSWGAFIDSLMREWKTMNIISVLLLS